MRLDLADKIAARLLSRLSPDGRGDVAGSVRRRKDEPRDIELVVPWFPASDDPIYDAMAELVAPLEVGLLSAPSSSQMFREVRGFKPGFRACSIRCDAATDPRWQKLNAPDFQVDVFRYDPGPDGNFGWVMLQRTGPAEFGKACLSQFKRPIDRGGRGGQGSRDGYLIDSQGERIATPLEIDAFMALGVAWVEPHLRKDADSVRPCGPGEYHRTLTAEEIPF